MKSELEALLFATDSPLSMPRLKALFPDQAAKDLRTAIEELEAEYSEQERAFTIVEFGGGWQIATRPEYAPMIEKLFRGRKVMRLSRAALEVLAIIAYRQPVTRMDIETIRGVQSSGVLSTLLERSLVGVVGRAETVGHPLLYGTTREFLNHLGLRGLGQLPKLPALEDMLDNRDALKKFASDIGQEITDDDLQPIEEEIIPAPAEEQIDPSETEGQDRAGPDSEPEPPDETDSIGEHTEDEKLDPDDPNHG